MTVDELLPVLAAYRQQVQPAWSPATAHKDSAGAVGNPAGQCGVTSAWLQERLQTDHGVESVYCVGDVHTGLMSGLFDHCWLQAGALVIDLTIDQAWPDAPFAALRSDRERAGLHYLSYKRLSAVEVKADPVQERLALLVEAMT